MFYQLPPAGNPVVWEPDKNSPAQLNSYFSPYSACYFGSGAESLAVAIQVACEIKVVDGPEVILPAYACPELVSAILFAGARPVLVDLQSESPWLDLDELKEKITQNTVAVIAVNLFGIPERLADIRAIIEPQNILLIEDSAQAFADQADNRFWQGDLVVLSFGRGKPVSVLGGGAVLAKQSGLVEKINTKTLAPDQQGLKAKLIYRIKVFLYNRLLHPRFYFFPYKIPWLKLGETNFHPMQAVEPILADNLSLLDANYIAYSHAGVENQQMVSEIVSGSSLINLPESCCGEMSLPRLIRYPVLAESMQQRDDLYQKLSVSGLGVSKMYPLPLHRIDGLEELFEDQGDFVNASDFAARLMTLPVHPGVKEKDYSHIRQIIGC